MELPTERPPHQPDLEVFLSAPVWQDSNGSTLSALSAFARLGIDPWKEAARLAELPRDTAVDALADRLTRLPPPGPEQLDHAAIARKLVATLPAPETRPAADAAAPELRPGWSRKELWFLSGLVVLLALLQLSGQLF